MMKTSVNETQETVKMNEFNTITLEQFENLLLETGYDYDLERAGARYQKRIKAYLVNPVGEILTWDLTDEGVRREIQAPDGFLVVGVNVYEWDYQEGVSRLLGLLSAFDEPRAPVVTDPHCEYADYFGGSDYMRG